MSDENKTDVDITKAAEDLAQEKMTEKQKADEAKRISELEAKLSEYQKKEEEAKKAEEEKRKSEISKRLEELEQETKKNKEEYEQKLEKLSERKTSGVVKDPKESLSREEFDANKEEYLKKYLNHIMENKRG